MKRKSVLVLTCLFLLGGAVGFLAGAGFSGSVTKRYSMDSNAGWLSQHIHYLALIRNGDTSSAVTEMEKTLDNSIVQLATDGTDGQGHFHPDRIPSGHLHALQLARVYADAGHHQAFSNESLAVLDRVSLPDGKYCSPALRQMQKQMELNK